MCKLPLTLTALPLCFLGLAGCTKECPATRQMNQRSVNYKTFSVVMDGQEHAPPRSQDPASSIGLRPDITLAGNYWELRLLGGRFGCQLSDGALHEGRFAFKDFCSRAFAELYISGTSTGEFVFDKLDGTVEVTRVAGDLFANLPSGVASATTALDFVIDVPAVNVPSVDRTASVTLSAESLSISLQKVETAYVYDCTDYLSGINIPPPSKGLTTARDHRPSRAAE